VNHLARSLLVALFGLILVLSSASAGGRPQSSSSRPDILDGSRQLIVVTTRDWNTDEARLERYERKGPGKPWKPVGQPFTVMVGKNGLGWGLGLVPAPADTGGAPIKKEGDGKAPAGIFRLGTVFGYSSRKYAGSKMPYLPLTATVECPDDSASAHYNTLVDRSQSTPDWSSSEQMLRSDSLYQWGIFVDHNSSPARPGSGSCIFLHIWRGPGRPTVGCTAMPAEKMEEMLAWLDSGKAPLLVQLPEAEYQRLQAAWGLPAR
jgi:D-alanyl-D-alanine dipeptidase